MRMTFDENILFRDHHLSLSRPPDGIALLSSDTVLMELKCGGALPLYIVKLLSEMKLYKTSFSKYGTVYRVLFGEGKTAGEEIRHA